MDLHSRFVFKITALLFLGFFGSVGSLLGESYQDKGKAPAMSSTAQSAVSKVLQDRYATETIHLEETAGGAIQGLFTIAGNLTPTSASKQRPLDEPINPRKIARAFLLQESGIFSLKHQAEELRLVKTINGDEGTVHLVYHRWVGELRLDGVEIRVHLNATGKLYAVDGRSVVVGPAEEAGIAAQLILSSVDKVAASDLILEDLQRKGISVDSVGIRQLEQVALPVHPYVIWKADVYAKTGNGRWFYEIDSVTGEILNRIDALKMTDAVAVQNDPAMQLIVSDPTIQSWPQIEENFSASSIVIDSIKTKATGNMAPTEGVKKEIWQAAAKNLEVKHSSDYSMTEQAQAKRQVEK